jgi:hypothetical protein
MRVSHITCVVKYQQDSCFDADQFSFTLLHQSKLKNDVDKITRLSLEVDTSNDL